MTTTVETFKRASFKSEGIWLFYIRESGEKVFIARFKHRSLIPGTGKAGFKSGLIGTSVDTYLTKLETMSPMHAVPGMQEKIAAFMEARKAA